MQSCILYLGGEDKQRDIRLLEKERQSVLLETQTLFCPFSRDRRILVDRLVGLVVKASASRAEGPGFESRLRRDFSGSSHTSDLNIGTPVATLPGAWRYRVSTGTGRPGVSIL